MSDNSDSFGCWRGRCTLKTVPVSFEEATAIVPAWGITIWRAMYSPSPMPVWSVVRSGHRCGADERIEKRRQRGWRDRRPLVRDRQQNRRTFARCQHFDWTALITVLDRVPNQIRQNLPQWRGIPLPVQVPDRLEAQAAVRMGSSELVQYFPAKTGEIHGRRKAACRHRAASA